MIGKSISQANAEKIANQFHVVFLGMDTDRWGKESAVKVEEILYGCGARNPLLAHVQPLEIPQGKDIGEMPQDMFGGLLLGMPLFFAHLAIELW